MTTITSTRYTGPQTTRRHKGICPGCGKQVTRSRTFEHTVNPFNRIGEGEDRRPKTWEEVRADVNAEADAWEPDFTCQSCDDATLLERASVEELLTWIRSEARRRTRHHEDGKPSRAALCNQRIALYERQLMTLDPARVGLITTSHWEKDQRGYHQRCYHEFPDGQRCIYSELHGAQFHLSPTGERAVLGQSAVTK